jgi:parallel beta-helix repeat protein
LTVGIILLFVGLDIIPTIAQDINKPSQPIPHGKWWYVGGNGPENYTNIQDAIDNASNGDTVFVFNGTYVGYVVINKSITLKGDDKNTTIIKGFFAYTVSIISDWVNMSGFTIHNNGRRGEGVRIDSWNNNFFDNIIDIPEDRIRISGDRNNISGNTIRNTYIYLTSNSNTIADNTITNTYYGIYLTNACHNIISNNSLFNSGLFISDDPVWNNTVTNNRVNSKPLVYIEGESNFVINNDAGQILLINSTNITVQNQHLSNATVGIQLWESNACIITGNTLIGNHYGISLSGLNNTIDDNVMNYNYYGLHFSGDNNTIADNTISNNNDGIYFFNSDHNTFRRNTFTRNQNSISMGYGNDYNNIINNTITKDYFGPFLSGYSNTLIGNTVTYCYSIFLFNGDCNNIINNIIAHNNGSGISIVNSEHNHIINNSITYNNYNGIDNNGIRNTISGNDITHNNDSGVTLFGMGNTLSNNTITNNSDDGILIYQSNENTILDNIISDNGNGIFLSGSSRNNITSNSILKNKQGILFASSSNNAIFKNNFLRNKRHALFENCTNLWDQNYWGRPRILPKVIFGVKMIQNKWLVPFFDIDRYPAQEPYNISGMS